MVPAVPCLATTYILFLFTSFSVNAEFNGEILLATPPANWSFGANYREKNSIVKTWARTFPKSRNWEEQVIIRHFPNRSNDNPSNWARTRGDELSNGCKEIDRQETGNIVQHGYQHAFVQVKCQSPKRIDGKDEKADVTFTTVKIIAGNFNRYEISRRWLGDFKNPNLPSNSPKILVRWENYFKFLRVCNTLFEDCKSSHVSPYSNERFRSMRPLKTVETTYHDLKKLVSGLKKLGILAGTAQACGEDTSTLLMKIERMIASVTVNDQHASESKSAFQAGITTGKKKQLALQPEDCGDARRRFRGHPTRISSFHKYIESFFE